MDVAALAVVANDALTTFCAQLLVPNNEPVNEPVKEPVLTCAELDTVPAGTVAIAANAYEAVIATDEDCAHELVPKNPTPDDNELV